MPAKLPARCVDAHELAMLILAYIRGQGDSILVEVRD